MVENAIFPQL